MTVEWKKKGGARGCKGAAFGHYFSPHPSRVTHSSTKVQSPSAFCFGFSRPLTPGLCRIGRGSFPPVIPEMNNIRETASAYYGASNVYMAERFPTVDR